MKIIHLLKKIEQIDEEIKDLRKMERSLKKNKSFTAALKKTIEKQTDILITQKNQILELEVKNPPENLNIEIDTSAEAKEVKIDKNKKLAKNKKINKEDVISSTETKKKKSDTEEIESPVQNSPGSSLELNQSDLTTEMPILTQDQIDAKFNSLRSELEKEKNKTGELFNSKPDDKNQKDEKKQDIKLLDDVLHSGALERKKGEKDRKIKFFRENFPSE